MPVGEMLGRMSSAELAEWRAFYGIEPWGDERADLRMGILASLYANSKRRRASKRLKPIDFMPFSDAQREQMTDPEEQKRYLRGLTAMLGGKIKGGGNG